MSPLFSGDTRGPDFGERGLAGLWLAAAALNDPCLQATLQDGVNGSGPNRPDPNATGAVELRAKPSSAASGLTGRDNVAVNRSTVRADVSIVSVLPEPDTDRFAGGAVTAYMIRLRYMPNPNVAEVPEMAPQAAAVGTPGATGYVPERGVVRFVPLSCPTLRAVLEWSAERVGEPPVVPKLDPVDGLTADPNTEWVRLGVSEFDPCTPMTDDGGQTLIYRTSGRFVYSCRRPRLATAGVVLPPFLTMLMYGTNRPLVFGGDPVVDIGPVGVAPPSP